MWMMLRKFINQIAGNQNTEAVNLNLLTWRQIICDWAMTFIQFSAVFNNQEIFLRAWGTTLHATAV